MPTEKRQGKLFASIVCMALGWLAGMVYFMFAAGVTGGGPSLGDLSALLYWTGVFALLGWVVVVVPMVQIVPAESKLFSPGWCPLFGALMAAFVFLMLTGFGFRSLVFVGHAVVIGGFSGFCYSFWLNGFRL